MTGRIRFHLDEHVASAVALGLRLRGIDVSTTAEEGLIAASRVPDRGSSVAYAATSEAQRHSRKTTLGRGPGGPGVRSTTSQRPPRHSRRRPRSGFNLAPSWRHRPRLILGSHERSTTSHVRRAIRGGRPSVGLHSSPNDFAGGRKVPTRRRAAPRPCEPRTWQRDRSPCCPRG
jgi:hypothetical protein